MEHTWTHCTQSHACFEHAFLFYGITFRGRIDEQVGVGNMCRVVDWQSNSNDDIDDDKEIEGQAPVEY